jgi:hypothetical protein
MGSIQHYPTGSGELSPVDAVVEALRNAGSKPRQRGKEWQSCCPVPSHGTGNGDRNPSLSVKAAPDGKALVHCHAGCFTNDVLHALGLTDRDLFPEDRPRGTFTAPAPRRTAARQEQPLPVVAAEVEPSDLDRLQLLDSRRPSAPTQRDECPAEVAGHVACYPYEDAAGTLVGCVHRLQPDPQGPAKRFTQTRHLDGRCVPKGFPPIPYQLPRALRILDRGGLLLIVEGEKDADTVNSFGLDHLAATTNAGGAGKWITEHTEHLRTADPQPGQVAILADNDDPGRKGAQTTADNVQAVLGWRPVILVPTLGKDITDHLHAGGVGQVGVEGGLQVIDPAPDPEAEPWEDPIPLGGDAVTASPVDLDGLPSIVREMVRAQAAEVQASQEIVLGAVLGTLAAATRGAWDVHVDDSWNAGPTVLWTCTLAGSGERKSAAVNKIVEPLRRLETEAAKLARDENRLRKGRRDLLEAQLREESKLGRDKPEPNPETVDALTTRIHEERNRVVPDLIVDDTTTEALGLHMTGQGGAVAIFATEAQAFQTVAGSYSDSGRANVGLLNHSYDGERYRDLRVKREPIRVHRPALIWSTAVQPEVLAGYATDSTEGSGFLARFLMFAPEPLVGTRTMRNDPVDDSLRQRWAGKLAAIHARAWRYYSTMAESLPDEMGEPLRLDLTPDARTVLYTYAQDLENEKTPGSELRTLGGWIEKHPAALARIAALFALLDNPHTATVGEADVRAALSMSPDLMRHALAAFAVMRKTSHDRPMGRVVAALRQLGKDKVKTTEVVEKVGGQVWAARTEAVRQVLNDLAEFHYLRGPIREQTVGRPSETWAVNPKILG